MTPTLSDPEQDQAAHIVALFTMLVHAWQTNDFHEAARARDQLDQMGVRVRLPRRRKAKKGAGHE